MAYRLAASSAAQLFRLRGLEDARVYEVKQDGRTRGALSGRVLSQKGLPVKLAAEWRAAVIELEARP
jgi:hypothetical protein